MIWEAKRKHRYKIRRRRGIYGKPKKRLPLTFIGEFELTPYGKKLFSGEFKFQKMIIEYLNSLCKIFIEKMERKIKKIVPKWRGYLRESLLNSLKNVSVYPKKQHGDLNDIKVKFFLYSRLSYSGKVNEMSTKWLVHPDAKPERLRYRGGIELYDPHAEHHFFQKLIKYGRAMLAAIFEEVVALSYMLMTRRVNYIRQQNIEFHIPTATGYIVKPLFKKGEILKMRYMGHSLRWQPDASTIEVLRVVRGGYMLFKWKVWRGSNILRKTQDIDAYMDFKRSIGYAHKATSELKKWMVIEQRIEQPTISFLEWD
ncbi:MAG: hypothetical protein ACTSUK_03875 [Promethearchaeota archaeon]